LEPYWRLLFVYCLTHLMDMFNILGYVPDMERFEAWNTFVYCFVGLIVLLSVWKHIEDIIDRMKGL
jgi:hypothetical protein